MAAQGSSVAALMLYRAARLALGGVLLGVAGALGLTRLMGDLLYEVQVLDPAVFLTVPAAMALVALVACIIPAATAARIDPGVALRSE